MLKSMHVRMIENRIVELNRMIPLFNKFGYEDVINMLKDDAAKQIEFLNKLKSLDLNGCLCISRWHYMTDGHKFLDSEDYKVYEIGEMNLTFEVQVYGNTLFSDIRIVNDYTKKSVSKFDNTIDNEDWIKKNGYHSIGGDELLELVINDVTPKARFVNMYK